MSNFQHLHPKVIEIAQKDAEERLSWLKQPRWLGYPRALDILNQLHDLMHYPRQTRMPSVLLIGDTNNGKTRILREFVSRYPVDDNPGGEHIIAPVLFVESPPKPDEDGLYTEVLTSLYESVPSSSTSSRRSRVINVLEQIQLKVLVIDELHNLLAGATVKQQNFLNAIKYLSNRLNISIVGSGTGDLLRAVSIDKQIQNRFTPLILPKWQNNAEAKKLLKSFECTLPLRLPSALYSDRMSMKIMSMSEGTIGEISSLISLATVRAIKSGTEKIDIDTLNQCGYISPSDRTKEAAYI